MASQTSVVRYHIAGRWSADDFSQLLRSANDIYNLSIILSADLLRNHDLRAEMFPLDRRKVRKLAAKVAPQPWLDVRSISYSSPGSVDLVGLGAVVGHVKDFATDLLDRYQSRHFRVLELKERLRIADQAKFSDEIARNNQLALARHDESLRALEITELQTKLERQKLKNRELHLANLDSEGDFVMKMAKMFKENDLSREQIQKIGTWMDSRASPVRELAELQQVIEVEVLNTKPS